MENPIQLQCKALRTREKNRRRGNNGEQWKSNALSNGSRRTSEDVPTSQIDGSASVIFGM